MKDFNQMMDNQSEKIRTQVAGLLCSKSVLAIQRQTTEITASPKHLESLADQLVGVVEEIVRWRLELLADLLHENKMQIKYEKPETAIVLSNLEAALRGHFANIPSVQASDDAEIVSTPE